MAGSNVLDQGLEGGKVGDIELERFNLAILCRDLGTGAIEQFLAATADHNLCTTPGEQCSRGKADSVTSARNNGDLAGQILAHALSCICFCTMIGAGILKKRN